MRRRDLLENIARPGIGFKRWYILSLIGAGIILLSLISLDLVHNQSFLIRNILEILQRVWDSPALPNWFLPVFSWISIIFGFSLVIYGAIQSVSSLIPIFSSIKGSDTRSNGFKVVVIGGGSGTFPVLKALRMLNVSATAIVTVADSGGSTGALRDEMHIPATGDIRRCLIALSDSPVFDKIMHYRFQGKGSLDGHSMGNLILASLTDTEGDFAEAVYRLSQLMATRGRVIPFTIENVSLCARYEDGSTVSGEAVIPKAEKRIDRVFFNPPYAKPYVRVLESLSDADMIIIGPGSLYTSLMPALLLSPIVDIILNTTATKVFISNIMTQHGETDGFSVNDHIEAIRKHTGMDFFDKIIISNSDIPHNVIERYRKLHSTRVHVDVDIDRERLITADLTEVHEGTLRHNETALARVMKTLIPIAITSKKRGSVE